MPRKAKGIHTSPEKAGIQNMPDNYVETHIDSDKGMKDLLPIWDKGFENRENYKGLWDEESFAREINAYFRYCFDNDVKPCKAGIALWLGTSKQTIWEWESKPEKHGFKAELLRYASQLIETSYIGRVEKYPTGNIFLLKTSHGHIETSKVDVTSTNTIGTADINELVSKMGLDKTK